MSIDMSKSYLSWGPTESVTYKAKRSTGDHTITVPNAKRRAMSEVSTFHASMTIELTGEETIFHLHVTQLAAGEFDPVLTSFEPQEHDEITDGNGRIYFVLPGGTKLESYGTRYRLICRKQVQGA